MLLLISFELPQSITKRSIQNEMGFVKSVMAKTLTVEYNPNVIVVVNQRAQETIKLLHSFYSIPC